MSKSQLRGPSRRTFILVSLAPVVVALIAAIVVIVSRVNGTLDIAVPLSTLLIVAGVLASAGVWIAFSLNARLRRQRDEAYEAGSLSERAAHRRFIARLDHELKNPVTAIRAALETEPVQSPGLGVAANQAGRLATLIGELRSLSSLETSEIERMPVDIESVIRDEAQSFEEDLAARGTPRAIHVQVPAAPWPLPHVLGDGDLLAVAIRNLLVNAAKYSDEGSRIEVRGAEDGGFVMVEVADTGWGIAESELPQVWDELWRSDQVRRVEGSGLGLSLVRVVAERHGGDVAIRSVVGSGTSVRIRVPIS